MRSHEHVELRLKFCCPRLRPPGGRKQSPKKRGKKQNGQTIEINNQDGAKNNLGSKYLGHVLSPILASLPNWQDLSLRPSAFDTPLECPKNFGGYKDERGSHMKNHPARIEAAHRLLKKTKQTQSLVTDNFRHGMVQRCLPAHNFIC